MHNTEGESLHRCAVRHSASNTMSSPSYTVRVRPGRGFLAFYWRLLPGEHCQTNGVSSTTAKNVTDAGQWFRHSARDTNSATKFRTWHKFHKFHNLL